MFLIKSLLRILFPKKECVKQEEKQEEKQEKDKDILDKMDATQDAAAIWELMKKSEDVESELDSIGFKIRAYKKLSTSKDGYTCRLLGENTFSYLDNDVKTILIAEIAQARVLQVEDESVASLELAKMVARQEKILDYDTFNLLKDLLKEGKIPRREFFKPEWINHPKIWEQTNYSNRIYLIKLKIFIDTAPIGMYVDKNGKTICEAVEEYDRDSLWEALMNKYNNVNYIRAFLDGFSDDWQ